MRQLSEMGSIYGEKHPAMVNLRSGIGEHPRQDAG